MGNDIYLLKLKPDKVFVVFQTHIPTLLESFLTVQIRKKESETKKNITNILMWYSRELKQHQTLVNIDFVTPKLISDQVL